MQIQFKTDLGDRMSNLNLDELYMQSDRYLNFVVEEFRQGKQPIDQSYRN